MFIKYSYKLLSQLDHIKTYRVSIKDNVLGEIESNIDIHIGEYFTTGNLFSIVCLSIIKIYSERKLNVGKNLFLFMRLFEKIRNVSVANQISYLKQNLAEYNKYHQEVQKFLLFS